MISFYSVSHKGASGILHLGLILSVKRLVLSDRLLCFFCTCPRCSNSAVRLWEYSWEDFPAEVDTAVRGAAGRTAPCPLRLN